MNFLELVSTFGFYMWKNSPEYDNIICQFSLIAFINQERLSNTVMKYLYLNLGEHSDAQINSSEVKKRMDM